MLVSEIFNTIKENLEANGLNVSDEKVNEYTLQFLEEDDLNEHQLKYFVLSIISQLQEEDEDSE